MALKLLRLLLVFYLLGTFIDVVVFLFANIVLDMAQVFDLIFFLIFLGNLNSIDSYNFIASSAAFIMLVFFRGLGLKLIDISKQRVMGLSLILIPILVHLTGFIFFLADNL